MLERCRAHVFSLLKRGVNSETLWFQWNASFLVQKLSRFDGNESHQQRFNNCLSQYPETFQTWSLRGNFRLPSKFQVKCWQKSVSIKPVYKLPVSQTLVNQFLSSPIFEDTWSFKTLWVHQFLTKPKIVKPSELTHLWRNLGSSVFDETSELSSFEETWS